MKIENKNCFDYLETLKDRSINLFLMDPPFAIGEQNFGSQYNRKREGIGCEINPNCFKNE